MFGGANISKSGGAGGGGEDDDIGGGDDGGGGRGGGDDTDCNDEADVTSGTASQEQEFTSEHYPPGFLPFERENPKTAHDGNDDNLDSNSSSNDRSSPLPSDRLTRRSPRTRSRWPKPYSTLKLESAHTIKLYKNLHRSVETEFRENLTDHLWSSVLVKRKQNEMEDRLRSGLAIHSPDDSEDPQPPLKRRRGRPRQSGPEISTDKLVTKSWTAWPLPYNMLPPLRASTAIAPAASSPSPLPPTPHPLEEAIIALFLRQSTARLRARNLPISADDTVSAHALKPTVGGILEKLDKLLLAVYESTHTEMRGELNKTTRGRVYRKVPMGWREVLGLASLARWDEGWSRRDDTFRIEEVEPNSPPVVTRLGPVGRATQRMCAEFGQAMAWRTWPEESHRADTSIPHSLPVEFRSSGAVVIREADSPSTTNPLTSLPSGNTKLHLGVHNDGFLDFVPKRADREVQRQLREASQQEN